MPDPAPPHVSTGSTGLADLGARLRAEWRDDEEMWMRAAAQRWAHGRRIVDIVRDYGARGDRIAVDVAGRSFEGVVVAVGDDRVDLRTAVALVSVRTAFGDSAASTTAPITIRRSSPARAGGWRLPSALVTFRARLLELEAARAVVRLGTFLAACEYVGPLTVGRDHVVVGDDVEVVVPACWVAYVVDAREGAG